jgi:hypothetical protein
MNNFAVVHTNRSNATEGRFNAARSHLAEPIFLYISRRPCSSLRLLVLLGSELRFFGGTLIAAGSVAIGDAAIFAAVRPRQSQMAIP